MRSQLPAFEQTRDAMDPWHRHVCRITRGRQYGSPVYVALVLQVVVSSPTVGQNGTPDGYCVRNERQQVGARRVWHMAHPHSSEAFWLLHLYGNHHDTLVRATATFATDFDTSDQSLINFHVARQLLTLSTNHRHSVTLKHRPCHPVADAHGALQRLGRQSVLGSCKVPSGLDPCREGRPRLVQNRACADCRLMAALRTHKTATRLAPRRGDRGARRTDKSLSPSQLLQIRGAGSVIGEHPDELPVGTRVIVPRHQSGRYGGFCT